MSRSRGAILGPDRIRYAQGYEAADQITPFVRGAPLAPAAWVDVTDGAGCVASTADDMNRLLRSLANAVQGRGGLGLTPQGAKAYTGAIGDQRHAGDDLRQRPDARGLCRPLLPPPHRRHGQLLLVVPHRCRERRRRVRELDDHRVRRLSPAPADPLRGRRADQYARRTAAARAAAARCRAVQSRGLCRPLCGPRAVHSRCGLEKR